jgi:hypothetical protein
MDKGRKTAGGRRSWRQWTEQEARAALAELGGSRETPAEFARRRGISTQRIVYWKKRLGESAAPVFVAVPLAPATRDQIEIALDGITLRVREDLDVEHLADIIGALGRRGRGC